MDPVNGEEDLSCARLAENRNIYCKRLALRTKGARVPGSLRLPKRHANYSTVYAGNHVASHSRR
jgi:hypothetical protein